MNSPKKNDVDITTFTSKTGLARVAYTAAGLGILLGIHLCIIVYGLFIADGGSPISVQWGLYFTNLLCFHLGEFFFAAYCQPKEISTHAFLLDHSTSYQVACLAGWAEYWIEAYFFPYYKPNTLLILVGTIVAIGGSTARNMAMYTCSTNFNLNIEDKKRDDHVLVTHGIYQYIRHPAYFGFFYWSIATQVVLCNPLCIVAYTVASFKFFENRIPYEEHTLRIMFGKQWDEFKARTPTGIPFIP